MKNKPGKKPPRAEFSTQNVEEHKNSLSVKKKNRNTKGEKILRIQSLLLEGHSLDN